MAHGTQLLAADGHANPEITARVYGHLLAKQDRQAVDMWQGFLERELSRRATSGNDFATSF
jgi:hypothetical protein